MGLAASQGRLLLLTARKSDLELQAQTISQDRLLLSIQQETIATEYSEAVNNQVYQIKLDGQNDWQAMSISALNEFYGNGPTDFSGSNYRIWDTRKGKAVNLQSIYQVDGDSDTPDSTLQRMLTSGLWLIQTVDRDSDGNTITDSTGKTSFTSISISGQSSFRQQYYTEDDAAAKAKYDSAMARVQRLDKQLELKLNQVETQHKAVETEVESVDKIISSNIESSFKYFS